MRRVFDRMKASKRAAVGLLAALIAVGPAGAVPAANVTDDASLLRNKVNSDFGESLVGQSFTLPLELQDLDVIFAPTDVDSDAIRRLGPEPRLRSPAVTRISPDGSPGTPAPAAQSEPDDRQAGP